MRYGLLIGLLWAQVPADSLRRLFEKDLAFDIVLERTFPVLQALTDTFPIAPFLSGGTRIGGVWRSRLVEKKDQALQLTLGALWDFDKLTLRATGANVAPEVELAGETYRWLKYRAGGPLVSLGLRWHKKSAEDLFPRTWVEMGLWTAYWIGRSTKIVALQEGRLVKIRLENNPHLFPEQGGAYIRLGYQWLYVEAYYRATRYFQRGTYGTTPPRAYPQRPRWEVGIGIAL